jgi:hypothetical protein
LALLLVFRQEWLALYWSFSSGVGVKFSSQCRNPKEMSQNLLTNKKQGKLDYVTASNIIKPT